MSVDPLFRRLPRDGGEQVTIEFEGVAVSACVGDSVASALLAGGHSSTRNTPVSGAPRGPFCMMGACFECLVEIDGQSNCQGCMVTVREGMRVRRMQDVAGLDAGVPGD